MSSSLKVNPNQPKRRHSGIRSWLINLSPQFFDRALKRVGLQHLKWVVLLLLVVSIPLIITPLEIWQQAFVALFLVMMGQLVVQAENKEKSVEISEYYHLFVVWLSMVTTLRYLYYRTSYTLNFDGWINSIFCSLLYAAELYAILTLALAYFQTLKVQEREPVDLAAIPQKDWYTVDIYIPTYNEEIEIVRKTTLAALACDYAPGKKKVYILDDGRPEKYPVEDPRHEEFRGRRADLQQMCLDLGCTLMTRDSNAHAKAGNINTTFGKTNGDLVLILDCDHIPSRKILMNTVGFFIDPKVSFVQTPHWFYNPDPFERNLRTGGKIPVGNELFYKVLQKGNDFWNAAFFCGSAAVIRKTHAMEVGGIAVETVTEDCHTALRLHSRGYKSIYYDKIMVAGLAPEKFSSYVGQQVRWARGMAQILRLENPMFNPKLNLTIPQRICYLSATSHFFYGFPRLVYAIAPTLFLLFGVNSIRGLGLETLAYAAPHILLALNANHIIYKHVRFSFWNEIFEFVMAFQAGFVTLMALINPKLGSFNVTDKGLSVTKRSFDWESMRGLVIVTLMVLTALLAVPFWLILRPEDTQAVLVNAMWCVINFILLVAALLVAFEQPQIRTAHRLQRHLSVTIYSGDDICLGTTMNLSETGALVALDSWSDLLDEVEIEITGDFGAKALLPAKVIRVTPINDTQAQLAIDFLEPNRAQLDALSLVIYSDVNEWYSQKRESSDNPFSSFGFLATSLVRSFRETRSDTVQKIRKQIHASAQIYWDGNFFAGVASEMSLTSLRLELERRAVSSDKVLSEQDLQSLQLTKPLVGLLLTEKVHEATPKRFLAEISAIESNSSDRFVVELNFPSQFKQRQSTKIKQFLKAVS